MTEANIINSMIGNGNGEFQYVYEYNMMNSKRGLALIFNHEIFADPRTHGNRTGTKLDCDKLSDILTEIQFEVRVHNDLRFGQMMQHIEEVSKLDYTDHDCFLMVIMSHGKEGRISAFDCDYTLASILYYFTDDHCPTLSGKPKLFFIQACRGTELDSGITLKDIEIGYDDTLIPQKPNLELLIDKPYTESLGHHKMPIHPDFLIAYSTIPGFYSWRSPSSGSWFMQALCKELEKNRKNYDILTLLTFVCQNVAMEHASNTTDPLTHDKVQIPCIITMLTRRLRFTEK